MELYDIVMSCF